ncbi:hypothetical protein [Rickettsiales endosymbiont of Stachyamoeba lipophora]|uniref:hypothetical protein n=1 Tax=Rickettsiales endosymbiont of Stachyamoeba lipophora TaxID=2486578 RepID=UPI000F653EB4|nr:hypothetical protein [Rickettsiales endosymbiont of Stachyamoeba lipophora]AZL15543.1 hypothetical protein EF513_03120 [Rickettsiales endosymbiont of Stachyamoeba lipophora]
MAKDDKTNKNSGVEDDIISVNSTRSTEIEDDSISYVSARSSDSISSRPASISKASSASYKSAMSSVKSNDEENLLEDEPFPFIAEQEEEYQASLPASDIEAQDLGEIEAEYPLLLFAFGDCFLSKSYAFKVSSKGAINDDDLLNSYIKDNINSQKIKPTIPTKETIFKDSSHPGIECKIRYFKFEGDDNYINEVRNQDGSLKELEIGPNFKGIICLPIVDNQTKQVLSYEVLEYEPGPILKHYLGPSSMNIKAHSQLPKNIQKDIKNCSNLGASKVVKASPYQGS